MLRVSGIGLTSNACCSDVLHPAAIIGNDTDVGRGAPAGVKNLKLQPSCYGNETLYVACRVRNASSLTHLVPGN